MGTIEVDVMRSCFLLFGLFAFGYIIGVMMGRQVKRDKKITPELIWVDGVTSKFEQLQRCKVLPLVPSLRQAGKILTHSAEVGSPVDVHAALAAVEIHLNHVKKQLNQKEPLL